MSTQQPDPQPGRYYVTAIDGPRRYFLAGLWPTHRLDGLRHGETVARRRADQVGAGIRAHDVGVISRK